MGPINPKFFEQQKLMSKKQQDGIYIVASEKKEKGLEELSTVELQ